MKEPPRLADGIGRVEIAAGDLCRQRAAPGQDRVRQRPERRRGRGTAVRQEPRGAPEIGDPLPLRQDGRPARQRGERTLLRAHLLQRVVGRRLEREPHRQGLAQRATSSCRPRTAAGGFGGAPRRLVIRRLPQVGEPRSEQAVADLEPVIEKAQRPIGRERRQPERQTRELDGHRVQVDAVQASLGDRSPDGDSVARRRCRSSGSRRCERAPPRTPPPDTGRRRPETRRCPWPDRRRAAAGCVRVSRRAPAVRASGARRSRRSAAACRTSRSPSEDRIPDSSA